MEDVKIYTVSEITRGIRALLEDKFDDIWVEGEISNFTVSSAGHVYFSLKDNNSLLNCVMFKSTALKVKFSPENGMKVLLTGSISVYDKKGQYQLYVKKIEPRGRGALQLAFEQLKKKLVQEGLFEADHKKKIPFLPEHVAVVTSPTGAVIRDILKIAKRRFPGRRISVSPVRVQGDEAKFDIVRAIEDLNEFNGYAASGKDTPIDVIILARGGGSLEDLWPFNEEMVARAIHGSDIPVVSAVGHEVDYTISDFIADVRVPTPSAASELVFPRKEDLKGRIVSIKTRGCMAVVHTIEQAEAVLETIKDSYVLRSPLNVVLQRQQQIDDLLRSVSRKVGHILELKEKDMESVSGKLRMLNPLAVLERGYSITFSRGKVLRDTAGLKKGDEIISLLAGGEITSEVASAKRDKTSMDKSKKP